MELIQIIYSVLLIGGSLLIFVVVISFLASKAKVNNVRPISVFQSIVSNNKMNYEQSIIRKNETVLYPQIFQINQTKPKEIKIIRKPTVSKREIQEKIRMEENHLKKTNGNGKRYTIVNEEMRNKKSRFRAANFYL